MSPTIMFEISPSDLDDLELPASASITDVKFLSSYNWINSDAARNIPTIVVPGSPALWSSLGGLQKMRRGSGLFDIAPNAAHYPDCPPEPLFRALYTTQPSFAIRSTDVVTDLESVRRLLDFVGPELWGDWPNSFTIDIEVIENTAIFCFREVNIREYVLSHELNGYGHAFRKANTIPQTACCAGHQRIISYRFGDLNFIVRHEAHAYVDTVATKPSAGKDNLKEAMDRFSRLLLPEPPSECKLEVKEEGQQVPLDSVLEIKTRPKENYLFMSEILPQLWVSQTSKLVRAHHQDGIFGMPVVEDVADRITTWEDKNQRQVRQLAALIRKIIGIVKECGGKAVLTYDWDRDKLVISQAERSPLLPEDLYSKWEDVHSVEAKADTPTVDLQTSETAGNRTDHSRHVQSNVTQTGHLIMPDMTHTSPMVMPVANSTDDSIKATVRINDRDYFVRVSQMPYFASFIRLQKARHPEATVFTHEPIALFDIAFQGVTSGYRQAFAILQTELSQYRTLCKTYEFLDVDVAGTFSTYSFFVSLLGEDRDLAHDTAFKILYLILQTRAKEDLAIRTFCIVAVMNMISNPTKFDYSTRRVLSDACVEQFEMTERLRVRMEKWEAGEASSEREI